MRMCEETTQSIPQDLRKVIIAVHRTVGAIDGALRVLPASREIAAWQAFAQDAAAQSACAAAMQEVCAALAKLSAAAPERSAVRRTLDAWQVLHSLVDASRKDMVTLSRTLTAPDLFSQSLSHFRDDLTNAIVKDTR